MSKAIKRDLFGRQDTLSRLSLERHHATKKKSAGQLQREIDEALTNPAGSVQGTPQERMKAKLEEVGIPFKQIDVYGSQIVITSYSRNAAERWARLLGKFAKVRGIVDSLDYAKENRGTVLVPTVTKVFLTFAVMR